MHGRAMRARGQRAGEAVTAHTSAPAQEGSRSACSPLQTKCVYEEINANVIVVGDFRAFNKDHADVPEYVDVRVGGSLCIC